MNRNEEDDMGVTVMITTHRERGEIKERRQKRKYCQQCR